MCLGAASLTGVVPTLPEQGYMVPLLEDRSTYCELTTYVGSSPQVQHSLRLFTSIEYQLPDELFAALQRGFVALVSFRSGGQIEVGYSSSAGGDRALRLVSCSGVSGEKPSVRGYKEWLFESVDSSQQI